MKECLSTKSVPISIDWLASACGTPTFWYTPDPRSAGGTNSALVPAACGRSGVEEGGEAIVGDTVARRRWAKAQSGNGILYAKSKNPTKSYGI